MTLLPTLPQCRDHSFVSPCQGTMGAVEGWCAFMRLNPPSSLGPCVAHPSLGLTMSTSWFPRPG